MAISKTQRWLDLIAFLSKRRFPVSVEDIMRGVQGYAVDWRDGDETARASVRRKFERDKDELRAAGIPLLTRDYRVDGVDTQGYVLAERELYLPDVPPAHAQLAMDALQRVADLPGSPFAADARSARTKLRFDHAPPDGDDGGTALAPAPVLYADGPDASAERDTLRTLTDALRHRRRVRFRYHGIGRDEATDRDVAPYGLLFQGGHWYLVGHDATRDAIRTFRLGRMERPETGKGSGPEFDPDPSFDLSAYARREPWELGDDDPVAIDVRFAFPLSLWAERNGRGREVERAEDGAVVRRFQVRRPSFFLRWLQAFGGDAIVVRPAEQRQAQVDLARATMSQYGGHG